MLVANWKLYVSAKEAAQRLAQIDAFVAQKEIHNVVIAPPLLTLPTVSVRAVSLCAQAGSSHAQGAFTGEIPFADSAVYARYALVGHSERRHVFAQTDAQIQAQVVCAKEAGLHILYCVGETEQERTQEGWQAVLMRQLQPVLGLAHVSIAYEPVWAIATKPDDPSVQSASLEHISAVHDWMRTQTDMRLLYGGSVDAHNAADILRLAAVDGLLVGSASVDLASFKQLLEVYQSV